MSASLAHSPPPVALRLPALPQLPPRGTHADAVAPAQRNAVVAGIVALHLAAVWGLLQIREVREAVAQAAPMFVSLIAPETPKPELIPPPPVPVPQVIKQRPPPQVIAAAPSPAPAAFVVPVKPPEVIEPPPPVAVVVAPAPPAPVPAAPVQPKVIPASAVQYLEPIAPVYPRLSMRMNETGRVLIRVLIDEAGLAKNASVNRSSGYPRLDEAALAAIQKARFKPYLENGQAVAAWVLIPLDFQLEK